MQDCGYITCDDGVKTSYKDSADVDLFVQRTTDGRGLRVPVTPDGTRPQYSTRKQRYTRSGEISGPLSVRNSVYRATDWIACTRFQIEGGRLQCAGRSAAHGARRGNTSKVKPHVAINIFTSVITPKTMKRRLCREAKSCTQRFLS